MHYRDNLRRGQSCEPFDTAELLGVKPIGAFLRAGNYRIVYAVAADTLNVLLVGKRNDDEIYRQLGRMVG